MGTNEADVNDLAAVVNPNDQPVLIAGYVENDPVVTYETGSAMLRLDFCRRPPMGLGDLMVPSLKGTFCVSAFGFAGPKLPQRPFGNHCHQVPNCSYHDPK